MRNAFAEEITKLAIEDLRIVLLSGDIGNRLFNPYKELHANRFLNCGVAEANMISMAAGMAMCGLRPVAYTITPLLLRVVWNRYELIYAIKMCPLLSLVWVEGFLMLR